MVSVRCARSPLGTLSGQCGRHRVPVQRLVQRDRLVQREQAGLVGQQPAHRDVRLAVRGELRPVLRHRRVQVQRTALGQHVRSGRGRPLGRRVDELQRVPRPRPTGLGVGNATPQVHHRSAVLVHAHRRADVPVFGEVRCERLTHRFEPSGDLTLDRRHAVHPGIATACSVGAGSPSESGAVAVRLRRAAPGGARGTRARRRRTCGVRVVRRTPSSGPLPARS